MGTIEIRTERLLLRKYRISDGEILYRNIGSDDELSKYTQWNPYRTYEMSRETVERFIKQYEDQHFYGWLIEADGRMAGIIGAYDYEPSDNSIEVGFTIERGSWGKGYASEALKAVIRYLKEQEKIWRIHAWCASENMASARVMQKAGMKQTAIQKEGLEIGNHKYDKLIYEVY